MSFMSSSNTFDFVAGQATAASGKENENSDSVLWSATETDLRQPELKFSPEAFEDMLHPGQRLPLAHTTTPTQSFEDKENSTSPNDNYTGDSHWQELYQEAIYPQPEGQLDMDNISQPIGLQHPAHDFTDDLNTTSTSPSDFDLALDTFSADFGELVARISSTDSNSYNVFSEHSYDHTAPSSSPWAPPPASSAYFQQQHLAVENVPLLANGPELYYPYHAPSHLEEQPDLAAEPNPEALFPFAFEDDLAYFLAQQAVPATQPEAVFPFESEFDFGFLHTDALGTHVAEYHQDETTSGTSPPHSPTPPSIAEYHQDENTSATSPTHSPTPPSIAEYHQDENTTATSPTHSPTPPSIAEYHQDENTSATSPTHSPTPPSIAEHHQDETIGVTSPPHSPTPPSTAAPELEPELSSRSLKAATHTPIFRLYKKSTKKSTKKLKIAVWPAEGSVNPAEDAKEKLPAEQPEPPVAGPSSSADKTAVEVPPRPKSSTDWQAHITFIPHNINFDTCRIGTCPWSGPKSKARDHVHKYHPEFSLGSHRITCPRAGCRTKDCGSSKEKSTLQADSYARHFYDDFGDVATCNHCKGEVRRAERTYVQLHMTRCKGDGGAAAKRKQTHENEEEDREEGPSRKRQRN